MKLPRVNVAALVAKELDHIDAFILLLLAQGVETNREISGKVFGEDRAVHQSQFVTSRISKLVGKRLVRKGQKGNDARKNPYCLAAKGTKTVEEITEP